MQASHPRHSITHWARSDDQRAFDLAVTTLPRVRTRNRGRHHVTFRLPMGRASIKAKPMVKAEVGLIWLTNPDLRH